MQTPKARTSPAGGGAAQRISPRSSSTEVTQKNSPSQGGSAEVLQKSSPKVVRQLKTGPRFLDHTASSSNLATKAPKERSPKLADHRSPKSPISEKKRQSRVSELENQISKLEKDLQTVKDQLCSTEELKKQAQKEAEESNQQLSALSLKLDESRKLLETSGSEEISEERDPILVSELDAIQKQHSHDTAALASALDEIKQLKSQLETVSESESAHFKNSELDKTELEDLKKSLLETLSLVEEMKNELSDCKESESRAHTLVGETLTQLETAKKKVEMLRSDGVKATEEYNAIAAELDQSRARVDSLEELVSKLKADISISDSGSKNEGDVIDTEINSVRIEVQQLRSALEAAEIRHNEEQSRSAEQMEKALETVEKIKSASANREAELESELRKSRNEIEELKANLMDKETELQGICEENESLTRKIESSHALSGDEFDKEIENLKDSLTEKEREWRNASEERERLVKETSGGGDVGDDVVESARAAEREALMKVGYMTEEVDKSHRRVARVAEQLEAAQAANGEMEAEMRRLKVQSDQWRKAAEAAAAMLSSQGNINSNGGQIMERSGSMDSHFNGSPRMGKMSSSPYGDDVDDDLMKKKNANMLRRIGVLWKKPHK
ncbi:hypothetical protein ABFX02_14G249900 [Erythranthe guttata]